MVGALGVEGGDGSRGAGVGSSPGSCRSRANVLLLRVAASFQGCWMERQRPWE